MGLSSGITPVMRVRVAFEVAVATAGTMGAMVRTVMVAFVWAPDVPVICAVVRMVAVALVVAVAVPVICGRAVSARVAFVVAVATAGAMRVAAVMRAPALVRPPAVMGTMGQVVVTVAVPPDVPPLVPAR